MSGVFKLDQMRAGLDEFFGLLEAVRFEINECIEAGDQVAMSSTNYHRGRDGIELRHKRQICARIRPHPPISPGIRSQTEAWIVR